MQHIIYIHISNLFLRPRHTLSVLESVLGEAGTLNFHLPFVMQLTDAVKKAKDWVSKVNAVTVCSNAFIAFFFHKNA